jgi:hypothetical protein
MHNPSLDIPVQPASYASSNRVVHSTGVTHECTILKLSHSLKPNLPVRHLLRLPTCDTLQVCSQYAKCSLKSTPTPLATLVSPRPAILFICPSHRSIRHWLFYGGSGNRAQYAPDQLCGNAANPPYPSRNFHIANHWVQREHQPTAAFVAHMHRQDTLSCFQHVNWAAYTCSVHQHEQNDAHSC